MGLYKSDRPMILYLGKQQVFKEPLSGLILITPLFDLKKALYVLCNRQDQDSQFY